MNIKTATQSRKKTILPVFPLRELELILRDELILAAETEAQIRGQAFPLPSATATTSPIPMDSLVVVAVLCEVESVLGFVAPDSTVQTGGYSSVQEALDHLMPKLEKLWKKKNGIA